MVLFASIRVTPDWCFRFTQRELLFFSSFSYAIKLCLFKFDFVAQKIHHNHNKTNSVLMLAPFPHSTIELTAMASVCYLDAYKIRSFYIIFIREGNKLIRVCLIIRTRNHFNQIYFNILHLFALIVSTYTIV